MKKNKLPSKVLASNFSLTQIVLSHFALQRIKSLQGEEMPGREGWLGLAGRGIITGSGWKLNPGDLK